MKYYYAPRIETDGGATEIDGAQVVLAEDYDRLREALTPSAETKAAYMGEFEFRPDEDMEKVFVPWTTIKQIMKAIRDRVALQEDEG